MPDHFFEDAMGLLSVLLSVPRRRRLHLDPDCGRFKDLFPLMYRKEGTRLLDEKASAAGGLMLI